MGETRTKTRAVGGGVIDWLYDMDGLRLDYLISVLIFWNGLGVLLDIRKHAIGFSFEEEGFITEYHVMFYSGYLAIFALVLGVTYAKRIRDEESWISSIPPGYGVGFLGLILFTMGGPSDAGWHYAFGIEEGFEGLLSPTHLTLTLGAALFVSSPIRAAWRRTDTKGWFKSFPSIFSAGILLSGPSIFTMYAHPVPPMVGSGVIGEIEFGLASFLVQMAIIVSLLAVLVLRFELPIGSYTFILTLNGLSILGLSTAFEEWQPILIASYIAAGVTADVLSSLLYRTHSRYIFRLFCVAVPVVWVTVHLAVISQTTGLAEEWTTHIWTGAIFISGSAGLGLSYLASPSPFSRNLAFELTDKTSPEKD